MVSSSINLFAVTRIKPIIYSLVLLTAISKASYCLDPTVITNSGPVRGAGVGVVSFKGISYAAAPVGQLRWHPPETGRRVAIPHGANPETCPVTALQSWLKEASIAEGPVFRPVRKGGIVVPHRLSGHAVASIVKRYARRAGLDVATFSGHSLRAGFVTSAARAGEPERRIMRQTGHKSIEMVLRYVRQANVFTDNAVRSLGHLRKAELSKANLVFETARSSPSLKLER